MSTNCNWGSEFIPANCQGFATGGLTGRFWILNKDVYDLATKTFGVDGEISDITLVGTGSRAYRIEAPKGSLSTDAPMTKNDVGISGLTHTINAFIPDLSMEMKNSLSSLFNLNQVVAIVETQADKPATSGTGDVSSPPYVLFGIKSGLEMSTTGLNLGDQATGGGVSITLTTPTSSGLETNYPVNVDMSTADIIALETPVV